MTKRILISGYEPSDFCNDIALKLKSAGYVIDLWEYREIDSVKTAKLGKYYSSITSGLNDLKIRSYSIRSKLHQFLKPRFYRYWWFHRDFKLAFRLSLGAMAIRHRFANYDVVNFHSIETHSLLIAPMVPSTVKVVFSFWGSDLFKAKKIQRAYQNYALTRVDQITLHSNEMAEQLIRTLPNARNKPIAKLLFGLSEKFIEKSLEPVDAKRFALKKEEWNIPLDKNVITVGYCGVPNCNHLNVFEQLNLVSSEVWSNIHLVVPLTYGGTPEYRQKVEDALNELPVSSTVIKAFLTYEDLVLLRQVSDIYIHSVSSDAFSTSMLEYLVTGNVGIIGNWLPYSRFDDLGVAYVPFENFESLSTTIEETVKNLPSLKQEVSNNTERIKNHLGQDYWSGEWVKVFDLNT